MNKKLKIIITSYAFFTVFAYSATAISGASSVSALESKAQDAITVFQKALKGELMAAMQKGGPKAAVEICSEKAPQIADKVSLEHGVTIRRTSLKVRNPKNEPNQWERETLEEFEVRKENGESLKDMSSSKYNGNLFTYMKPIPMKGICTSCHGTNVPKPLYLYVQKFYPNDNAIGFKPGDIRGAFVVEISKRQ